MPTTELTTRQPVLVVTREVDGDDAYFRARQGGITATELRDWKQPAKRRAILTEKATGEHETRKVRAFDHGNYREPFIAEWAAATHGVVHSTGLYAHPDNPRYLATADGHLAGFTLTYEPGPNGVTVEIKTTTKDLTPGRLDANRVVVEFDPKSHFAKTKYLRQIMWQMFVMNAARCLFIWEPYTTEQRDPESGNYVVTGPPEWVIIERDQAMIDELVAEADAALELIDSARATGLPPVSDIPVDEAILLNDLFDAREALAIAEAKRVKAWEALGALYEERGEEFSEERGFAQVSYSPGKPGTKKVVDTEAMKKRAPSLVARYEALVKRHTRVEPTEPGKPRMTITDKR
ncbi:exonuclease [Microbacterium phage Fireman]|uniref:Exonuclease n=2 Tax=Metamorphoovirus TaxID=2733195 RepID=A0A481VWQ3_9CAUD|nr:RecE-like recombination exonuclease [Microbacterium phage Fireman]YP_010751793.1 exonuclease [Microbacterium phage Tyrumbra]QBI98133.1 exonuclease [Microbacterium phage Fireman]QDP43585.1 exonuclease [Microbacterium phage Tyrumbra]